MRSRLMTVLPLLVVSGLGAQTIPQAQFSTADSPWNGLVQKMFGTPDPNQLLPSDQAFKATATATGPQTIVVQFVPAKGYYFYREKFVLSVQQPSEVKLASVDWPRGEIKSDPFFGRIEVFDRPAEAVLRLNRTVVQALETTLRIEYQGCNYVVGVCYPPAEKRLRVELPVARIPQ
jgi:thiol:disulfide interchange protein DsbD